MKLRDVAFAWIRGESASAANLSSDGRSLLSFGWYEIGRRVSTDAVYIRHANETYSVRTARHVSEAIFAANSVGKCRHIFRPTSDPWDAPRMGQPDWKLLSWDAWFRKAFNRFKPCSVVIRRDAQLTGKPFLCSLRDHAVVCRLVRLFPAIPGQGAIEVERLSTVEIVSYGNGATRKIKKRPYSFDEVVVNLDILERVPEISTAYQLTVDLRKEGPRWTHALFPGFNPPDVRKSFNLWPSAFEHGAR